LRLHGITNNRGAEFWSIEATKNCEFAGLGIAYLPMITVKKELDEGKLARLRWDDRPYRVTTKLVYHRKKWLSPALEEWICLVHEHAARWRTEQEKKMERRPNLTGEIWQR
jgi:DNA-binding transcriptional LysR family regulator